MHVLYNGESKAYAAALAVPYGLRTIKGFEKALARSEKDPHAGIWHLKVKVGQTMHKAAAARISATGWLLITIDTDS